MARGIYFILLFGASFISANGQNLLGFPSSINFTTENYQSGNQNWKIKQDAEGLIYVANNDGLLCYDGQDWNLYKLLGAKQMRAIEIGDSGLIYAGGLNELGFFSNSTGRKLGYTSLTQFLPPHEREFGAIWSISIFENAVFFRSAGAIHRWQNGMFTSYNAGDWRFLGVVNGRLFAQNGDEGLFYYDNGKWVAEGVNSALPLGARVANIVSIDKSRLLVVTQNHGFFILKEQKMFHFKNMIANEISNGIVSAVIKVGLKIVVGTRAQGLYIVDENFLFSEHLTRSSGLHNNHVISLFADNQFNLWVGLDNGVSMVSIGSSIRKLWPDPQDIGAGYAVANFDNSLYLGTANGLYAAPYDLANNKMTIKSGFKKLAGTKGQVWKLSALNGKLWMAHHNGAFLIEGNTCIPLDSSTGYWDFVAEQSKEGSGSKVYGLSYNGIVAFDGNSRPAASLALKILGSRHLLLYDDMFFVAQQGERVLQIDKEHFKAGYRRVKFLPENDSMAVYHLCLIDGIPVACTSEGVFEYSPSTNYFMPSKRLGPIFRTDFPEYLHQDRNGRIWFIHNRKAGFISGLGNNPQTKFLPELFNKVMVDYEQIETSTTGLAILGSTSGFYTVDLGTYNFNVAINAPKISKVRLLGQKDSVLLETYGNYEIEHRFAPLKPGWKSIEFHFVSPFFGDQKNVQYSFMLEGNDKHWSAWSQKSAKEYTNLQPGSYVFKVKSSYNGKSSATETKVIFEVLPTWYQSKVYRAMLIVLALVLIWQLLRVQHKKGERRLAQEKIEQEQLRYLQQLELDRNEKEIIKLKNEKLEAEINFKNAELASTAMHLVQKGEFIEKFKIELSNLVKMPPSVETKSGLNKLIKSLDNNERIDAEWDVFAKHFDQTHKDFLLNLKSKFPQLSPNDVKLCAYIKIDLSTKEIAQLLNISVRGVEISRYRLRRKMEVPNRLTFHAFLSEQGL
jgi:DNA-binding CsgD family transcriptional regulator